MKVTLLRFKKYVEVTTRDFNVNNLTLLDGESGTGKTTVLEAILWCLYGKMVNIYPTGSKSTNKDQTSVTIDLPEMGNISIKRSKPPDVIEVKIPGHATLTSDAAQSYIEQLFGPRDLFITSSYIRQDNRCPLITGSNNDKTQLLHQLTFGSVAGEAENPETYLNRIDHELQGVVKATDTEVGKYNGFEQVHSNNMSNYLEDHNKWDSRGNNDGSLLPKLEQPQYVEHVSKNNQRLQDINDKMVEISAITSKKELVQSQLTKLVITPPTPLPEGCNIQLEALKSMISSVKEQVKLQQEVTNLELELDKIGDFNITSEELERVRALRVSILEQKAAYTSLGINYGPTTANDTIDQLKAAIQDIEVNNLKKDEWDITVKNETEKYEQAVSEENKRVILENEGYRVLYEQDMENYGKADKEYHEKLSIYNEWTQYTKQKREFESYLQRIKDSQASLNLKVKSLMDLKVSITEDYSWYQKEYCESNEEKVDFAHLERTLNTLKMLNSQLHCPHCNGSLIYKSNSLHKGMVDTANKEKYEKQISSITEYIGKLTKVASLTTEVQKMEASIGGITKVEPPSPHPEYDLHQTMPVKHKYSKPVLKNTSAKNIPRPNFGVEPKKIDVKPYNDKISQLESLKYVEGDISTIDSILEKAAMIPHTESLKERLSSLKVKIIPQDKSIEELNLQVSDLEDKIKTHASQTATYNSNIERKSSLERELELYVKQEMKFTDGSDMIKEKDAITRQNVIINELIRCHSSHTHLVKSYNALNKQKAVVLQYTQYKENILKLKQTIQKVASDAMEEVVEALSIIANKILREIFVDDIEVVLKTTKELKSKKATTKLQVNLKVFYRGDEYDSPSPLSGGEKDRISLAMTLAMAKISGSPVLMLDECMASLSEALQERCLEMIQEYSTNKTVIHVCHRAIQGQHDCVLMCCGED